MDFCTLVPASSIMQSITNLFRREVERVLQEKQTRFFEGYVSVIVAIVLRESGHQIFLTVTCTCRTKASSKQDTVGDGRLRPVPPPGELDQSTLSDVRLVTHPANWMKRVRVVFDSGPLTPLRDYMTLSRKPAVHIVSHWGHRRTEPRRQVHVQIIW